VTCGSGQRVGPDPDKGADRRGRAAVLPAAQRGHSLGQGHLGADWDGSDQQAFLRHLTLCRTWAVALEQETSQRGIGPEEIGRALGRPASSVAKLIDEWLWAAISGSFSGDGSR
jgi:hypothetical protein